MLEKISLRNFQYHKKSKLELSEGLNVIYGDNGQGKSCVLRALNWIINNKPSGFGFKTRGNNITNTEVDFVIDNQFLKRKRNKSTNEYVLNGTTFKALRTDIPEEVSNLLNISDYAYRGQHAQYFLFHDSDGEVAKKINKVVGLNQIDIVLSKAKSLKEHNKKEIEYLKREVEFCKNEFSKYKPATTLQNKVQKFEKEIVELDKEQKTHDSLNLRLKKILWLKGRVKAFTPLKQLLSKLKQCLDANKKAEVLSSQKTTLNDKLKKIEAAKTKLDSFSVYKKVGSDLKEFQIKLNQHSKKEKEVDSLIIKHKKITFLLSKIKNKRVVLEEKNKYANKTEKTIDDIKKKFKICPLCGNNFKE